MFNQTEYYHFPGITLIDLLAVIAIIAIPACPALGSGAGTNI
jgi:Tfp pilus assembly protein PilE